jgi:hypothetical protein
MRRAFETYQYVAPAICTPLAALLWWRHYDGEGALAAIALLVPIVHSYVVPGIGTNILRVWEFDTRLRLGGFRPHHGFVFGSVTAMLTLLAIGEPSASPGLTDMLRSGLLAAGILGPLNWLYDVAAIHAGILRVYNQAWAEGRGSIPIVNDYALWFFGGFGLIHGAGLKLAEGLLLHRPDTARALAVGVALVAATAVLPTCGYVIWSYLRHGHHGCRPVVKPMGD